MSLFLLPEADASPWPAPENQKPAFIENRGRLGSRCKAVCRVSPRGAVLRCQSAFAPNSFRWNLTIWDNQGQPDSDGDAIETNGFLNPDGAKIVVWRESRRLFAQKIGSGRQPR